MYRMEDIMGASFGETSSDIAVSFRKTVNIKQYESEVIEASSTVRIDRKLSGIERMIVAAMLEAQLEYECYVNLALKKVITPMELEERKNELTGSVNSLINKGIEITGKDFNYLFEVLA